MSENIIVIANGECPVLDKDGRIITPGKPQGGAGLPPVTDADDGDVLGVEGGAWTKTQLPAAPVSSVNGRTGAVTVRETPGVGAAGTTLQRTGSGADDVAWLPGVVVLQYRYEVDPETQEPVYHCDRTEAEIAAAMESGCMAVAVWSDIDNPYAGLMEDEYTLLAAECRAPSGIATSYLVHNLSTGEITVETRLGANIKALPVTFTVGLDPQTYAPDYTQVVCDEGWDQMRQAIANGTPIAAKLGFIHPVSQEFIVLGTMVGGAVDPTNPVSGDVMLGVVIGGTLFDFAIDASDGVTVTIKAI